MRLREPWVNQPIGSWGAGGTGREAASISFFGFKVVGNEIEQWWKEVKNGWKLVKETIAPPLEKALKEQETVCKAVGYGSSVALYYVPDSALARQAGLTVGLGSAFAC